MAVKDHSLDQLIIDTAKEEFLKYGYEKASLRNIVKKAGITTGALYTRYKNKDELFESLIVNSFKELNNDFKDVESLYYESRRDKDVNKFLLAVKQEEKIYLDFLFSHYDECVLLMTKSDGSELGKKIKSLMEQKINDTIIFFEGFTKKDFDKDALYLIMSQQFNYFKVILEKGYSKEKATKIMKTIEDFIDAGWKKLFIDFI